MTRAEWIKDHIEGLEVSLFIERAIVDALEPKKDEFIADSSDPSLFRYVREWSTADTNVKRWTNDLNKLKDIYTEFE